MDSLSSILRGGVGVAIIGFGIKLIVAQMIQKIKDDYEEKLKNAVRDAITRTETRILFDLRKEDNERNEKKCC